MTIPQRPPNTGKGSGAQAWREYAAALTDSPVESWSALSREEISDLLEAEGVVEPPEGPQRPETDKGEARAVPRRRPSRPVWMRPTDDGGYEPE